jgi:hypothetical protein
VKVSSRIRSIELEPVNRGLREYTVTYNDWVKANTTVPLNLTPNFTEPPPTIQCPAPITVVNAPGLCGAPVMFSPTVDGMCPDVTAHSSKASGSFFAVGTTPVTSYAQSASDPQHPSDPCTFTVTVHDNESPAITCPAPIVVNATGPAGVVVSYAPTVSDNCSVTSTTCVPASGSTFAVGDSTAKAPQQTPPAISRRCSFNVHVKGAAEQTSDLIAAVNNLATKAGTIRLAPGETYTVRPRRPHLGTAEDSLAAIFPPSAS